jgi:hypothetical protein
MDRSKIDVDEKGSLDKATVYAGLEDAGEGNYDTVRRSAQQLGSYLLCPSADQRKPICRSVRRSRRSTSTRPAGLSSRTGLRCVPP